nr:hypothetical protein [Capnocytophaga canimorsus]
MHIGKMTTERTHTADSFVNFSNIRYLPRWIIFGIDVFLLAVSLLVCWAVLDALGISSINLASYYLEYLLIIGVNVVFMLVFRTFKGIIRHSTFIDLFKILLASVCTILVLWIINLINISFNGYKLFLNPLLFIYFGTSFIFLFFFRFLVKQLFYLAREFRRSSSKRRILILGVDEEAVFYR